MRYDFDEKESARTTPNHTTHTTIPTPTAHDGRHTPDIAFDERRTDRLLIRRFRIDDASSLAAYRSDPVVARYQSWDIPFTNAQAESFIDSFGDAHPDTAGEWFPFAVVEAATGEHLGDVAAGIDTHEPRLATIGVSLATSAQGRGYAGEAVTWLLDYLLAVIGATLAALRLRVGTR